MRSYDVIAPFYDVGVGDRSAMAALVRGWINKHRPDATRVLELACGTASILRALPREWEVWGADLSRGIAPTGPRENSPRSLLLPGYDAISAGPKVRRDYLPSRF